jgi:hypothetical protein
MNTSHQTYQQQNMSSHPGHFDTYQNHLQVTSIANTNAYNTIEDTAMESSGSQS